MSEGFGDELEACNVMRTPALIAEKLSNRAVGEPSLFGNLRNLVPSVRQPRHIVDVNNVVDLISIILQRWKSATFYDMP
jgi:hypothetical protein